MYVFNDLSIKSSQSQCDSEVSILSIFLGKNVRNIKDILDAISNIPKSLNLLPGSFIGVLQRSQLSQILFRRHEVISSGVAAHRLDVKSALTVNWLLQCGRADRKEVRIREVVLKLKKLSVSDFPIEEWFIISGNPFENSQENVERVRRQVVQLPSPIQPTFSYLPVTTILASHLCTTNSCPTPLTTYSPVLLMHSLTTVSGSVVNPSSYSTISNLNNPPRITGTFGPIMVEFCKYFSYRIPTNLFSDDRDGDTTKLVLSLRESDGRSLVSSSWIQFNPNIQTMYGILTYDVFTKVSSSNIVYHLLAQDSAGLTASYNFIVSIPQTAPRWNYNTTLTLSRSYNTLFNKIDELLIVMSKIHTALGDQSASNINPINFNRNESRVTVTWSNCSLAYSPCPYEVIDQISTKIFNKSSSEVLQSFKNVFFPEYQVMFATEERSGPCLDTVTPIIVAVMRTEELNTVLTKMHTPVVSASIWHGANTTGPTVNRHIGILNVTFCKYFLFRIPDDIFLDQQDGNARNMKLTLLTMQGQTIKHDSWLQIDPNAQVLYGFLKISDYNKTENSEFKYRLIATDSSGLTAETQFVIKVTSLPPEVYYEVELTVNSVYGIDTPDIQEQLLIATKISIYFQDSDLSGMNILAFTRNATANQVTFGWTNCTLKGKECPKQQVEDLSRKVVLFDGTPNSAFIKKLEPQYRVYSIKAHKVGVCARNTSILMPIILNMVPKLNVTASTLFTYVIPSNTFQDSIDGSTRQLSLELRYTDNSLILSNSWLQFNNQTQEIYGMLTLSAMNGQSYKLFNYILVATNSRGYKTNLTIVIRGKSSGVTSGAQFTLNGRDYTQIVMNDVQILTILLRKLSIFLQVTQSTVEVVEFRRFILSQGTYFTLTWQSRFISADSCNFSTLNNIESSLMLSNQLLNPNLIIALSPEVVVNRVHVQKLGSCLGITSILTVNSIRPTQVSDLVPEVRSSIPTLTATTGIYFYYQIPERVFFDRTDGGTRNLLLQVADLTGDTLSPNSWIQFDNITQSLYGILNVKVLNGMSSRSFTFVLIAVNSIGYQARLSFIVTGISTVNDIGITIEFRGREYNTLGWNSVQIQTYIVTRLRRYLGIQQNDTFQVLSFERKLSPASQFSMVWTDSRMQGNNCNLGLIQNFRSMLFLSGNILNPNLILTMVPNIVLYEANLTTYAGCKPVSSPTSTDVVFPTPSPTAELKPRQLIPIPNLNVTSNILSYYQIPENAFYDTVDGYTRNLKLFMTYSTGQLITADSWIQFNNDTQTTYGLFQTDTLEGQTSRTFNYILNVMNSRGYNRKVNITVVAMANNIAISIRVVTNARLFTSVTYNNLQIITMFISRVQQYLSITDNRTIVIVEFERVLNPIQSSNISWTISTINNNACERSGINDLRLKLLLPNGQVNPNFIAALAPDMIPFDTIVQILSFCSLTSTHSLASSPLTSSLVDQTTSYRITATLPYTSSSLTSSVTVDNPPLVRSKVIPPRAQFCIPFSYPIPNDLFYDQEDGGIENLKVTLHTANGTIIGLDSWLQFSKSLQVIYGILKVTDFNNKPTNGYQYLLKATDSTGQSTTTGFTVKIPQYPPSINHIISLTTNTFFTSSDPSVNEQLLILTKIASFYGDKGTQAINVISYFRTADSNNVTLRWSNCSLNYDPCPWEKLLANLDKIYSTQSGPADAFKQAMLPQYRVYALQTERLGPCSQEPPVLTSTTRTVQPSISPNQPPVVLNPVRQINMTWGLPFELKILNKTFYNDNDGFTRNLELQLSQINGLLLPKDHWLQFNVGTWTIYGYPKLTDFQDNEIKSYVLKATDRNGISASQIIYFKTINPKPALSHYLNITATCYVSQTLNNVDIQILFWRKIGQYFNPDNTIKGLFNTFFRNDGSTIQLHFQYSNGSLSETTCDRKILDMMRSKIFAAPGILNSNFIVAMAPQFIITDVKFTYAGVCLQSLRASVATTMIFHQTLSILPSVSVTPIRNLPPVILKTLPRIEVNLCSSVNYIIPENTFYDVEDGLTRNLRLSLRNADGSPLGLDSLIRLNVSSQTIYGILLKSDADISPSQYLLTATDRHGLSVFQTIGLMILDNGGFTSHKIVTEGQMYSLSFTPALNILNVFKSKLENYLKTGSERSIKFLAFNQTTGFPSIAKIIWSYCFSSNDICNSSAFNELATKLEVRPGVLNPELVIALAPDIIVTGISINITRPCIPVTTIFPASSINEVLQAYSTIIHTASPSPVTINRNPSFLVNIPPLTAELCKPLRYQLPTNTCYDPEDGYIRNLLVALTYMNGTSISRTSWIQFDTANQMIIGLLKYTDIGVTNVQHFQLICVDKDGLNASQVISISTPINKTHFTNNITVDAYIFVSSTFTDLDIQLLWLQKLNTYLQTSNTNHPAQYLYFRRRPEAVQFLAEFAWAECSLELCNETSVTQLKNKLFSQDSIVSSAFSQAMVPEFVVISAKFQFGDICQHFFTSNALAETITLEPSQDQTSFISPLMSSVEALVKATTSHPILDQLPFVSSKVSSYVEVPIETSKSHLLLGQMSSSSLLVSTLHMLSSLVSITSLMSIYPSKINTPVPTGTPPIILENISTIYVSLTKILYLQIPQRAFYHPIDGYTRNLTIRLTNIDKTSLSVNSWIQFNNSTQTIYGILTLSTIQFTTNFQYSLIVTGSNGMSIAQTVFIKSNSTYIQPSHSITIKAYLYNDAKYDVDLQILLIEKITRYFISVPESSIVFGSFIRITTGRSRIEFTWSNSSFFRSCNESSFQQMVEQMLLYGTIINLKFIAALAPDFIVYNIQANQSKTCDGREDSGSSTVETSQITPTTASSAALYSSVTTGSPPRIISQVPVINAELCGSFSYRIPENTFFDQEDGNTRQLTLSLYLTNGMPLPRTSWIQFIQSTQVIYGLFKVMERQSHNESIIQYSLVAMDKDGNRATTTVRISLPKDETNSSVSVSVNVRQFFDLTTPDLTSQLYLLSKISTYFGDQDLSKVLLISFYRPENTNYIDSSWTNCTLLSASCPNENITSFISKITLSDGSVNPLFAQALSQYPLISVSVELSGSCKSQSSSILLQLSSLATEQRKSIYIPRLPATTLSVNTDLFSSSQFGAYSSSLQVVTSFSLELQTSLSMFKISPSPVATSSNMISQFSNIMQTSSTADRYPVVLRPIGNISSPLCGVFTFQIPADTFHDQQDGNARRLRLSLTRNDGEPVTVDSWIQINSNLQVLYGILTLQTVRVNPRSLFQYKLVATNSKGLSTSTKIQIHTIEPPKEISHQFTVTVQRFFGANDPLFNEIFLLADKIRAYFGSSVLSDVLVVSVNASQTTNELKFTWSNCTLSMIVCDRSKVDQIKQMVISPDGNSQSSFAHFLRPQYTVNTLEFKYMGLCETGSPTSSVESTTVSTSEVKIKSISSTVLQKSTFTPTSTSLQFLTVSSPKIATSIFISTYFEKSSSTPIISFLQSFTSNVQLPTSFITTEIKPSSASFYTAEVLTSITSSPRVNQPVSPIDVTLCGQIYYKIPDNTFYDPEDGPTRNLKLSATTMDGSQISVDYWIQFIPTFHVFYGQATLKEIREQPLQGYIFIVRATDSDGFYTQTPVTFRLQRILPKVKHNFTVVVSENSAAPAGKVNNIATLAYKISSYMKDKSTTTVGVLEYARNATLKKSTLTWYNCTFPPVSYMENCLAIRNVTNEIVSTDGEVNANFAAIFFPQYQLISVIVNLPKACTASKVQEKIKVNAKLCTELYSPVPNNTFHDSIGSYTNSLTLTLVDKQAKSLDRHSWVQFSSKANVIYGVPTFNDLRKQPIDGYHYLLIATDKEGLSTNISVIVYIQGKLTNITYQVSFVFTSLWTSATPDIDILLDIKQKLSKYISNNRSNDIGFISFMRAIDLSQINILIWTNCSLLKTLCDVETVQRISNLITQSGKPLTALDETLGANYTLKRVFEDKLGPCFTDPSIPSMNQTSLPVLDPFACGFIQYQIPEDTFYDAFDGNTRNLFLYMQTLDGQFFSKTSWINFNSTSQTVYAIGTHEALRHQPPKGYIFNVHARNSRGATSTAPFRIYFLGNGSGDSFSVRIKLLSYIDPSHSSVSIMRTFLKKLEMFFSFSTSSTLGLSHFDRSGQSPEMINASVFNCTTLSFACDPQIIDRVYKKITKDNQSPNERFEQTMKPEFEVLSVFMYAPGKCKVPLNNSKLIDSIFVNSYTSSFLMFSGSLPTVASTLLVGSIIATSAVSDSTHASTPSTSHISTSFVSVSSSPLSNSPPVPLKKLYFNVSYCGQSTFQVPDDTFLDSEDGGALALKLDLLETNGSSIHCDCWIQFNQTSKTIFTVLAQSIEKKPREFILTAEDKEGLSSSTQVVVSFLDRANSSFYNITFMLQLSMAVNDCDTTILLMFLKSMASYLNDADQRHQTILSYSRSVSSNIMNITWTNCSLSPHPCDSENSKFAFGKLLDQSEPKPALRNALAPVFHILKISTPDSNFTQNVTSSVILANISLCGTVNISIPKEHLDTNSIQRYLKYALRNVDGQSAPALMQFNRATSRITGNVDYKYFYSIKKRGLLLRETCGTTIISNITIVLDSPPCQTNASYKLSLRLLSYMDRFSSDYSITQNLKIKITKYLGIAEESLVLISYYRQGQFPQNIVYDFTLCDFLCNVCNRTHKLKISQQFISRTTLPAYNALKSLLPEFVVLNVFENERQNCSNHPPNALKEKIRVNITLCTDLYSPVPKNTFYDSIDGYTNSLTLTLVDKQAKALDRHSWVQFSSKANVIYGVPTFNDLRKQPIDGYHYLLIATDKEGLSTNISVIVYIQGELTNITYQVSFVFTSLWTSATPDINILLDIKQKLSKYISNNRSNDIGFISFTRAIDLSQLNILIWTNCSLSKTLCDIAVVQRISSLVTQSGKPLTALDETLGANYTLKRVFEDKLGPCFTDPSIPSINQTSLSVQVLDPFACGFIEYQIPEDTFYDVFDGNTRNLFLYMQTLDGQFFSKTSWINFNSTSQTVYAIGTHEALRNQPPGGYIFYVHARNSRGSTSTAPFRIYFLGNGSVDSFSFRVKLLSYMNPTYSSVTIMRTFLKKLEMFFNVSTSSTLGLSHFDRTGQNPEMINASVFNCTSLLFACDPQIIDRMYNKVTKDNQSPDEKFKQIMKPEFEVLSIFLYVPGKCKAPLNNSKPVANESLPTLNLSICESLNHSLPDDTFIDKEDGNIWNMTLQLFKMDGSVISDSDIFLFDNKRKTISGVFRGSILANSTENIVYKTYILKATDSQGASSNTTLKVRFPMKALYNYSIQMVMTSYIQSQNYNHILMAFLRKMYAYFGDTSNNNIVILSITATKQYPSEVRIGWSNCTLQTNVCNRNELSNIRNKLLLTNQIIRPSLIQSFAPDFVIYSVQDVASGSCNITPSLSTTTIPSTSSSESLLSYISQQSSSTVMPTPVASCTTGQNTAPIIVNNIRDISVSIGQPISYFISSDAFYDVEDSTSRNVTIEVIFDSDRGISNNALILFNNESSTMYISALQKNNEVIESSIVVSVRGTDSCGAATNDAVEVRIRDSVSCCYYMSVELNDSTTTLLENAYYQYKIYGRLREYYSDSNGNLRFYSIQRRNFTNITIVSYTNQTFSNESCFETTTRLLADKVLHDNGSVRQEFISYLSEYKVIGVKEVHNKVCNLTGAILVVPGGGPIIPIAAAAKSYEDWIWYVVPILAFALLLLLCCLCFYCCRICCPVCCPGCVAACCPACAGKKDDGFAAAAAKPFDSLGPKTLKAGAPNDDRYGGMAPMAQEKKPLIEGPLGAAASKPFEKAGPDDDEYDGTAPMAQGKQPVSEDPIGAAAAKPVEGAATINQQTPQEYAELGPFPESPKLPSIFTPDESRAALWRSDDESTGSMAQGAAALLRAPPSASSYRTTSIASSQNKEPVIDEDPLIAAAAAMPQEELDGPFEGLQAPQAFPPREPVNEDPINPIERPGTQALPPPRLIQERRARYSVSEDPFGFRNQYLLYGEGMLPRPVDSTGKSCS